MISSEFGEYDSRASKGWRRTRSVLRLEVGSARNNMLLIENSDWEFLRNQYELVEPFETASVGFIDWPLSGFFR